MIAVNWHIERLKFFLVNKAKRRIYFAFEDKSFATNQVFKQKVSQLLLFQKYQPGKRSLGARFLWRDLPFPGMEEGHIFEHEPENELHQEEQPETEPDLDRPEIDGED